MTDQSNTPQPPACKRATPRQGTSYMAFRGEPLAEGDPLLGFRPVPHKQARRNSINPPRQRAFIAALAGCGIVTQAARHIGASMEALYKLRNRPGAEEFRAAWDAAVDRGIARLEDTALTRAMQGEERMVVSGGKVMGYERRFNDALVMFFLRNRRGERYAPDWRALKPGHPVYERIAAEGVERYQASEPSDEEVFAELDQFIDEMRERRAANEAILKEFEEEDARRALPGAEPDEDDAKDDNPE